MNNIVLKAYTGNAPYIFISYAHKDADRVLPIISALQKNGFRVWFDQGIEAGSEWPAFIASRLKGCHRIIAFVSPAFVDSRNCRNEINYALNLNKEMLAIYLEPTELMYGLELQMISSQAMFKFRSETDQIFFDQLFEARILTECRGSETEATATAVKEESGEYTEEEFKSALRITSDEGKISAVMLQTRLDIGKAKAENIIATMVKKRYICAPDATMTYRVMTAADKVSSAKKTSPAPTATPTPPVRKPSEGLKFFPSSDMESYKLDGIGACKDITVVIPDTYDGYPVTEIDMNPNKSYCHSEFKMYIPAGIRKIKNLGVVSRYLVGVEVDPQNGYFCSEKGVLFSKDKKKLIYLRVPNSTGTCVLPSGITEILDDSVHSTDLYPYELKIPEGVTKLGDRAIKCSSMLKTVRMPRSITTLESKVFYFGKDITIAFDGTRKQWEAIKKDKLWDVDYGAKSVSLIKCRDGEIRNEPLPDPHSKRPKNKKI